MLWRFSFASTSTLDSLLGREIPPSVEEIMDDTDVLQECKSQNNKLVNFLSKDDSIKSLLHWVVSGLDELDEESRQAEKACLVKARKETTRYPPFEALSSTNHTTNSTTSTETKEDNEQRSTVEEGDKEKVEPVVEAEEIDLSAGNMGMLNSTAPGETDEEGVKRARYPTVAAEILTSEIWVIPETILSNKDTLLRPFWDAVIPPVHTGAEEEEANTPRALYEVSEAYRARVEFGTDEDDERDRKREIIRGLWVKVNGNLIAKRSHEMVHFIQTIPNVIPRLVAQIHSPAIQDILIRLISAEEGGVSGVIAWLSEERLVNRLTSFLSPLHPPHIHVLATELLKNIITLCAPPPFNLGGNMQEQQSAQGATSGTRDNRMVRELVNEASIRQLVGYMLDPLDLSDSEWPGVNSDGTPHPSDPFIVHPLPSTASAASSLSHISTIFVELIRRNNSDFAEPHLFHTLRNRLMNMRMEQGAPLGHMEEGDAEVQDRERMEEAVKGMSEAMGIVHLRSLLDILCERFDRLNTLLREPRSQKHSASPACPRPLTLERFRIVELFAELLHSSNMSILNRPTGTGPGYSYDGILSGGLAGLEALGEAIDEDRDQPNDIAAEEQVTQARELPVSSNASISEEIGSDSEDEKMLEDIEEETTPSGSPKVSSLISRTSGSDKGDLEVQPPPPSQADAARLRDVMNMDPVSTGTSDIGAASHAAVAATTAAPSVASFDDAPPALPRRSSSSSTTPSIPPPGVRLKQVYLRNRVIPALIDMFFEHAANDFLHHVVYDMLQQILNGKIDELGPNRELVLEMICEAKLVERVLEAQTRNTKIVANKGPRLPYMGHIILIAEEIVKFLPRCKPDLAEKVLPFVPQPAWDEFVAGQLQETRARDTQPLAGGKPLMGTTAPGDGSASKSEDEESSSDSDDDEDRGQLGGFGTFGEPLQRTKAAAAYVHRGSGSGSEGDNDDTGSEEETNERYWHNTAGLRRHVDSSDDEEEDADWMRPNDDFGGLQSSQRGQNDDFDNDDTWGSFSSGGANNAENPFGDDGDDNFSPSNDAFAPSVPAQPSSSSPTALTRGAPLTPADWFDREFSSAWDDDSEAVPAIVVPAGEDDQGDEADVEPDLPRTPGSTWSFSGEEGEGEDLPHAISPVIDQDYGVEGEKKDTSEEDEIVGGISGLGISDASSLSNTKSTAIPIPSASTSHLTSSAGSPSDLSTSPNAPIPDRTPQAPPIPNPASPKARKPPPPPPSPRRKRTSSQSGDKPTIGVSPPDASLVAATSSAEPLGPGVGTDVKVTDEGMLKREIGGKEVVVPKDEVVLGLEEANEEKKRD